MKRRDEKLKERDQEERRRKGYRQQRRKRGRREDWREGIAKENYWTAREESTIIYVPLPYILHLTDSCPFSK